MSSNWPSVKLTEVCSPKQWPTVPKTDFTKEGYPVFGANGQIGFYKNYNHEHETVLVTCRGATCGSINICPPRSYVTGNAMALDNLNTARIDMMFLYHLLKKRGFADVISGSAQPQITRQGLDSVKFDLPPIEEQRRIAAILDKANAIRRKQEQALALADDFLRATFLDMFGDPVINSKHLETVPIKDFGRIITGNTPSRAIPEYYGEEIEWIKSDNINTPFHYLTEAEEGLTNSGKAMGRIAMPGSVLVTCIAGSFDCIGNAAIANREVCFNQQINAIEPFQNFDTEFLYAHILVGKKLIQRASTNSMKGMVSKGKFQEISFVRPPEKERIRFSKIFQKYMKMCNRINGHCHAAKIMYEALSQRAFNGEL